MFTKKEYEKQNLIPFFDRWGLTGLSTTCYGQPTRYQTGYEMRGTLSNGRRIVVADISDEPDYWFFTDGDNPKYFSPFRAMRFSPPYRIRHISHLRDILIKLQHQPLIEQEEQANINEVVALFRKAMA